MARRCFGGFCIQVGLSSVICSDINLSCSPSWNYWEILQAIKHTKLNCSMANNSSVMKGGSLKLCLACGGRFKASMTNTSICSDCQKILAESKRQKVQASNMNPITSEYLQLLDSRIAELEHAAELSSASEQSRASTINTNNADQLGRPVSGRPSVPRTHMTDYARSSGAYSSRQSQNSVAIERYLNDSTEPDSV